MTDTRPSRLLRRVLLADAALSGLAGLLMIAGAAPLATLTDLPQTLLLYAGLPLLPFAALLAWLSRRDTVPTWLVWTIVAGNAVWAIDSVVLLFTGWIAPNTLGVAFVAAQAAAVAVLAELQFFGLRRSEPAAVAA